MSLPHSEHELRFLELAEKIIHGHLLTSWFFNVREGLINQYFQVLPVFLRLFPTGMEMGIESSSALRLEPSL